MTGTELFEQIVARIESMVGPQADHRTRQQIVTMMTVNAVLGAAANAINEQRFEVAHDLVLAVFSRVVASQAMIMQDEQVSEAVGARLSSLLGSTDPDLNRFRVTESAPSALSPQELVYLGVVERVDDAPSHQVHDVPMQWVAFATQVPQCTQCSADACAVLVWMDEGDAQVYSSSLCESCANGHAQAIRQNPEYLFAGNVMYLRAPPTASDPKPETAPSEAT